MNSVMRVSKAIGGFLGAAIAWGLNQYALVDLIDPQLQEYLIEGLGVVAGVFFAPKNAEPAEDA